MLVRNRLIRLFRNDQGTRCFWLLGDLSRSGADSMDMRLVWTFWLGKEGIALRGRFKLVIGLEKCHLWIKDRHVANKLNKKGDICKSEICQRTAHRSR